MNVEITKVKEEERLILSHLIELYEYDFSDFNNSDVNSLGLYGYSYLDYYWTEPNRFPYFIKVDGKLAGFVLVCNYCYVSKEPNTLFLSEFFVMKKYRRKGVGKIAAKEILKKHGGRWELTVHPNNVVSHKFWENVIREVSSSYQSIDNVSGVYDDALAIAYIFDVT